MSNDHTTAANSLDEYWMPFTPQRDFKKAPRMVVRAEGMYYYDDQGREILDGAGGLWCVNAGHNAPKVTEAIKAQAETLDYASSFNYGHPMAFKAASRLVAAMPEPISNVFFSNSGSEAVDTALKIALAYQRARGQGTRRVLIGRERAYHGVGFGGMSVGGIPYVRAAFGQLLPAVDHLPHTYAPEHNAFSRGQPEWGAHLADNLEDLITLHDPMNVAAVIVEPVSGSTGVLPPPKGYLKRIREICDKHDILMILDEVICGFGRFGDFSSSEYFGIMPDIITTAKGLTNGAVPMGATFVTKKVYEAFENGPDFAVELSHGYTYSGHPLACAAALATLDTFQDMNINDNAKKMAKPFEDALHSLKGKPHVVDIRNCGMLGAIQIEAYPGEDDDKWTREAFKSLFEHGVMVRLGHHALALSPPLILDESHIDRLVTTIGKVLDNLAK